MKPFLTILLLTIALNGRTQPGRYIPAPVPAKTDYLVGALYFAGWKTDSTRNPWAKITPFPDRKPLLGYYDEGNPEVTDWEIKWALEHGLSYFTYCWYRKPNNLGHAVTDTAHAYEHALHRGLFNARFRDRFRFAILWENNAYAGVASLEDLQQNVFPYWLKTYFKHPSYLLVDGKPVLYVFNLKKFVANLGGPEPARQAIDWMRAEAVRAGFKGLLVLSEARWSKNGLRAQTGTDAVYFYSTLSGGDAKRPTAQEVVDHQMKEVAAWVTKGEPVTPGAIVGWDPLPWAKNDPRQPWYQPEKMNRWSLTPAEFGTLLTRAKTLADAQPADAPGRRLVLLSNWNEWGEGMHLAPHAKAGFGYLTEIRRVFTTETKPYRPVTPEGVGRGPYDSRWRKFNPLAAQP